jgi:hypothetical protein
LIDTIAMIGSPASRGAASLVGAGRTFASLVGAGSRLGVGSQRRQCGHRRERHNGGPPQRRVATVDCRHGSIHHPMPRLKCLSALASSKIGDQLI